MGRKQTHPISMLGTRPHAAPSLSNTHNKIICSHSRNPPPCTNIGRVPEHARHIRAARMNCSKHWHITTPTISLHRSTQTASPSWSPLKHGPRRQTGQNYRGRHGLCNVCQCGAATSATHQRHPARQEVATAFRPVGRRWRTDQGISAVQGKLKPLTSAKGRGASEARAEVTI